MHCSVIEHGYDVIEFSNCSTEERGVLFKVYCLKYIFILEMKHNVLKNRVS